MLRTTSSQALLIGLLATLASFCALHAFGEQPHSIVAQSNSSTAATGRKPLGQRIAAANLPIVIPARAAGANQQPNPGDSGSDQAESAGEPAETTVAVVTAAGEPTLEAPALEETAAASPPAETPSEEESQPAATEPQPVVSAEVEAPAAPARVTPVAAPPAHSPARNRERTAREALLQRLKNALAGKTRSVNTTAKTGPTVPKPRPMPALVAAPVAEPSAPVDTPVDLADDATVAATAPESDPMQATAAVTTVAASFPASADTEPTTQAPARIEFDVRESRSLVNEGEQLVVRIAVRNVGTEPAEQVNATLFFAEGIEPVQAIGHTAEVYPGEVRFDAVPTIPPGDSVDLLVMAVGTRPGSVTYRGELDCERLAGRIAREGAVTVRPRRTGGQ